MAADSFVRHDGKTMGKIETMKRHIEDSEYYSVCLHVFEKQGNPLKDFVKNYEPTSKRIPRNKAESQ